MSTFGPAIRLKSVLFKESVRFPGSSASGHYIPAEDYPLTYYPQAHLVEARLKPGVEPMPNFTRRNFYPFSQVKDAQVIEDSLPPETAVSTNDVGQLVVPAARMKLGAGGSFERMTDEEIAAEDAEKKDEAEAPAPAPKKRAKKAAKAVQEAYGQRPDYGQPAPAPKAPRPAVDPDAAARIAALPRGRVTNTGTSGGA